MAQFQPGQSGNPSGRPKKDQAITAAALAHAEEALSVVVANMRHEDPKISQRAAETILDRAYGKPPQSVDHGSDPDKPVIHEVRWLVVSKP